MTYVSLGPGMNEVITANPEVLEHILKNKFSNYPKGPDFQSSFGDLLGHGIFNSDGEAWKQQRKTASLEFSARSLRDLMMVSIQDEVQLRLLPTLQTVSRGAPALAAHIQESLLCYTFYRTFPPSPPPHLPPHQALESAVESGSSIDIQDILLRYTFDNICRIGFGVDPGCLAAGLPDIPFARAFDDATKTKPQSWLRVDPGCLAAGLPDILFARAFDDATKATQIRNILPDAIRSLFMSWGIAHEKILKASVREIDEFAHKVIETRKEQLERLRKGGADAEEEGRDDVSLGHSDILSSCESTRDILNQLIFRLSSRPPSSCPRMMMLQKDDGGQLYSERFLRDACTNFILAGRDTSSVLLTWFFWLLSWHPHVESKIVEEARSIIAGRDAGDERETFTYDELRSMTYTHAALNEALRLYPSVPADTKHVSEDSVLPDGTPVKKGWRVMYALYAMGHITRIWGPDVREYRPERWIDFFTSVSLLLSLLPSHPTRHVSEDDVLPDGTPVKKGWRVMYALYAMGRMTRIWGPDAREYRPERWIDSAGQLRSESPFKFPAFNAGPRLCLGRDLAYLQGS
ncbi:unnamed protein product [Closterium sp. Naga37s-1]|nr:unnamed protein product [Closterium sp. Naga37s-1]